MEAMYHFKKQVWSKELPGGGTGLYDRRDYASAKQVSFLQPLNAHRIIDVPERANVRGYDYQGEVVAA